MNRNNCIKCVVLLALDKDISVSAPKGFSLTSSFKADRMGGDASSLLKECSAFSVAVIASCSEHVRFGLLDAFCARANSWA